jgi:Zn finger protein HypA/HybF involved in hydrogenase expression
MTVAVLTRTLDEELAAIVRGETVECLVCGEQVEAERGRVECPECGSVLERRGQPGPDQLALI